ncbi:alpha/beta hydrolase family protein [Neptunomonas sp.]|uniref:alpha/beta hydrolase family protein n=1 Tax=Neptunomonas sp. TaxID=1971898 RepID=UPI00356631A1
MSSAKVKPLTQSINPDTNHVSAEQAVAGLKDYGQLACDTDGVLFWVEYRPEEAGRNCLIRYADGVAQNLTPPGFDVRSRVHEYGGLSWCLLDSQSWVFVNKQDQQLYRQQINAEKPEQLTFLMESRFGEPVYDAIHHRVLMIEEQHFSELHSSENVINRLVSLSLTSGEIEVLHEGHDFYSSLVLSGNGRQCLFISWDHPHQPWTATQLHHGFFGPDGLIERQQILAGQGMNTSILQPSFDHDGGIWAMSDQSGWWNLCRYYLAEQRLQPYWQVDADCTTAPWQFGGYHYHVSEQQVTVIRLQEAAADLLQLKSAEVVQQLASEYSQFRAVTLSQNKIYAVANALAGLPQVIEIDQLSGHIRQLSTPVYSVTTESPATDNPALDRTDVDSLAVDNLSVPQHISFPVGDQQAFGFFYPPVKCDSTKEDSQSADSSSLPPVVFFFHGGPTACTYPVLNPRIQYWTQRGFAVMDLNYRGSSGYGRAYRLLLHKRWGISDVEDAEAAVQYLSDKGLINPQQVFVRGSSAGGFTALAALAFSDKFSGGASLYGVTDPLALAKATHKFESHYLDWLIGSPVTEKDVYQARSPLAHASQIKVPVIFFQGELDAVVVPEQTRAMVAALQQQQIPVEVHYYAQEGHGFRSAENLADALEKEYHFYQRIIGVE